MAKTTKKAKQVNECSRSFEILERYDQAGIEALEAMVKELKKASTGKDAERLYDVRIQIGISNLPVKASK